MVLLIIDAQRLITTGDLYNFEGFVSNVKQLISAARSSGVEIMYVRHDDGPGKALTRGTEGYEIYDAFMPVAGERIFDKTVNSPFKESGLLEYLRSKGESQLMVTGLQTDYCIDATVKCGFEHGFNIIVPAHANTTFDNDYMTAEVSYRYHNEFTWKNRYAQCISMEEALEMLGQKAQA